MIACFLSNISAKYYKNLSMLSRVIAKNVGDVFFETQCSGIINSIMRTSCENESPQRAPEAERRWGSQSVGIITLLQTFFCHMRVLMVA